mgnify:CR=1|tara:strand:- start:471 stop:668 length:198 start_codon:yes stop_codon:yes gene_type:complete
MLFLNIINKNVESKTTSRINKICKLPFKKDSDFELIKDKNVNIHNPIQKIERKITNLKLFNLLNI